METAINFLAFAAILSQFLFLIHSNFIYKFVSEFSLSL